MSLVSRLISSDLEGREFSPLSTFDLLLDLVVLLSGNVQDADSSATEKQDVVGEGGDLSSQFDSGHKNQSTGSGGIWGVGRESLHGMRKKQ